MTTGEHGDSPQDLARKVRDQRDLNAFAALYDGFSPAAFGMACRVLGTASAAEDVVQDVFLAFWRQPDRYDPARGAFRPWLLSAVHHRAVDAVRRSVVRSAAPLDAAAGVASRADTAEAAVDALEAERVRAAIADLTPEQRHAIMLGYWGGHTQAEIAQITGVPVGTVKSRVFAAMRRMRATLTAQTDQGQAAGGWR